jgi:Protein of unknown function (DUF664)
VTRDRGERILDPHADEHKRAEPSRVAGDRASLTGFLQYQRETLAFRVWEEECARSRATVDAAESLDATVDWRDEVFTLRYIITHMIEEYARHNGHADLLRERIDGTTGE